MNFLGIGPGELILIIILTLVVVGPERLPGMARQAGQILVRMRNWLQTSPDAAMVLRARQEIEQELAQLRTSLLEVQNVRDEVIGVAKQIDEAVSPIAAVRPPSLAELLKSPEEQTISRDLPEPNLPTLGEDLDNQALPANVAVADMASEPMPDAQVAPDRLVAQNGLAPAAGNGATQFSPAEIEALGLRIQAVMADLFALQEQLKQRGLLADDWRPPSHTMQMPQPDAPIEEVDR